MDVKFATQHLSAQSPSPAFCNLLVAFRQSFSTLSVTSSGGFSVDVFARDALRGIVTFLCGVDGVIMCCLK